MEYNEKKITQHSAKMQYLLIEKVLSTPEALQICASRALYNIFMSASQTELIYSSKL